MPHKRYTPPRSDAAPHRDPGVRRHAVLALVAIDEGAPLDTAIDRDAEELSRRDRGLFHELVTGVVRHRTALDWLIDSFHHTNAGELSPTVRNGLRVAIHQLLHLDRIPPHAAVDAAVETAHQLDGLGASRLVNGLLRSLLRSERLPWPDLESDPQAFLSVTTSHPQWLVERWWNRFGPEECRALLEANNTRAPLNVRVNPLRTEVEHVAEHFITLGLDPHPGLYDSAIITVEGLAPARDPAFREGAYTVQDEASLLVARLCDARPGTRAIDLCAAPGGKAGALAEMMEGKGTVEAVEITERGCSRIAGSVRRLGLGEVVHVHHADGRTIDIPPASLVLVDAPCSGLGVIRKKPDIKWRRAPEQIPGLVERQRELIEAGARLVAPGGVLIYATCTTEPEENEEIVEWFLGQHPEFTVEPASEWLPEELCNGTWLRTLPHRHGVDGAFGARLRRAGS